MNIVKNIIIIYLFISLALTLLQAKNDLSQERDLSFKKDKIVGGTIHGLFKAKEAQHVRHLAAEVEFDNQGIEILNGNNQRINMDNIPDNYKSKLQILVNDIVDTNPLIFHGLNFFAGPDQRRSMEAYHSYWNEELLGYLPMFSTSLLVSNSDKPVESQAAFKFGILFHVDDTFIHVFNGRDLYFKNPLSKADDSDDSLNWNKNEHRKMGSENCDFEYANRDAELERILALSELGDRLLPTYLNECYIRDSNEDTPQDSDDSNNESSGGLEDSNDLKNLVEDHDENWVTFHGTNYKNKLLEMSRENSRHDSHNEVVASLEVSKILVYAVLSNVNQSNEDFKDFAEWCINQEDNLCVSLANIHKKHITVINL